MTTNQTSQALIGAFRNRLAAEEFVNEVLRHGYTRSEVSLLMTDQLAGKSDAYKNYDDTVTRSEVAKMENEGGTAKFQQPMFADIACGGTAVATAGANLVVCGPMKAALDATLRGGHDEDIRDLLIDVGVSEQDASFYETIIREGGIVVSVGPHFQELSRLGGLMNQYFAEHVSYCKSGPVD